jgi:cytochrome c-type biogenesis protein CcsB
VPVNHGLANLSNVTLVLAVGIYALAMLGYAGDFAFGTRAITRVRLIRFPALAAPGTAAAGTAGRPGGAEPGTDSAMAGAASGSTGAAGKTASSGSALAAETEPGDVLVFDPPASAGRIPDGPGDGRHGGSAVPVSRWPQGRWLQGAFALTCVGLAAHLVSIVSRGVAEDRTPWGNMYEFIAAVCCMTVLVLVAASVKFRAYYMGLFVLLPVLIALALDVTVVYTPAGQLVPALQSYWIAIHVTAMILAIGIFMFGAVVTVMYLLADRYEQRAAAGLPSRYGGILDRLPGAVTFDRLAYRSIMFGFPTWMFGIFAGAMWANEAWGRPWGWDPKETWSLITLVVYAAFLHARATSGWRGRRAAYIQLVAFACLMFNVSAINLWVHGLHSYAGVN